ncbi:bifunctional diguanylate cyclase/phosphodiesterase [Paenibacillus sp. V4I5]|uniref:putative bifunctional diguanylate cyclase/phosphodiesterase n=1 Tax=Paenibacillus sp. V4I5 TaxID=3042306 RepID=UPI002793BB38|nr:EAL domain-containing protein [Paenibacillus sp. V4I5]MDQ0920423.1 diguanylate cyclase (GGDEF)-like protein [Paenibacillus sp. V4I5]
MTLSHRTVTLMSKSLWTYWLLGALAFLSYAYPVSLVFSLQLFFASLFILLSYHLFGWKKSAALTLIVHTAAVFFLHEGYILLLLLTLEIAFVMMYSSNRPSRNGVLLPGVIFWLGIGVPSICLLYYWKNGHLDQEIGLYVCTLVVNLLFNALMADILYKSISIYMRRSAIHTNGTSKISLTGILIYLSLFSIIGSSLLFIINTGKSAERSFKFDLAQQMKHLTESLRIAYASWSPDQMLKLELRSSLQIAAFRELLRTSSLGTAGEAILLHKRGHFILSTNKQLESFPWMDKHNWTRMSDSLVIWEQPHRRNDVPGIHERSFALVHQIELGNFTLYVKLSTESYVREVTIYYISQSVNVLYTVIIIGVFALFLHRFIIKSIMKLAALSHDLPNRIKEGKEIHWIHSDIGEVHSLIHNFRIVTEKIQQMLGESKEQAYFDSLTGLPNRRHFNEHLDQLLRQNVRTGACTAVMFIDLDRFKQINDTLGHGIGDGLLKQVTLRLTEAIGNRAFIARLGGDEFVIVMKEANKEAAGQLAVCVLEAFASSFKVQEHELFIGGSIGISLAPQDGVTMDTVVKHADAAMYLAKGKGGNIYRFYKPQATGTVSENMVLEFELRKALERNELSLHYQPIMDTQSSSIIGAEALLRWDHSTLGRIPPIKVISVAENSGLIGVLGEWVIREACRQLKDWLEEGFDYMRLAINLSPTQLVKHHAAVYLSRVLDEMNLPSQCLDVEITEEVFVKKTGKMIEALQKLQQQGIRIWIDDFGTGYSSLTMLKKLPIDGFKIDRSFIQDMREEPGNMAIVQTLISLAGARGWSVIAEGIEEQEDMAALQSMSCSLQQGYYHWKPMPAVQLTELLRDQKITSHERRGTP